MRAFLILLALLVAVWLLRPHFLARRDRARARRAAREIASRTPTEHRQESVRVIAPGSAPTPVPPPVQTSVGAPLGTAHLDEPGAERPELDIEALHRARATVVDFVPDEVLQDALLDATPQDLSRLLAEVPQDVLARAVGTPETTHAVPLKAEEARQIAAVAEGLDDLDIWNFGDAGAKA